MIRSLTGRLFIAAAIMLSCSRCATIVSKSNWPLSVQSEPSRAKVTITNRKGKEVYSGKTPCAMLLKSGSGFFSKESYTITISMNGYETKTLTVECKVNGWYFGNILIGGVIGMLIVDPATGAMYKLESDNIHTSLDLAQGGSSSLRILEKNNIPAVWAARLVPIQ